MPYRRLQLTSSTSIRIDEEVQGAARTGDAPTVTQQSYTIQSGDTLWGICRTFYGDGTLAYKLADYNGIKNANLIYDGDTLKLPEKSLLTGG